MTDLSEQQIQTRLDYADPFTVEFFQTCTDEKILQILDATTAKLNAPLLKNSASTKTAMREYIQIGRDVMGLRTIVRMRKKELDSDKDRDADALGMSLV